jgi:hypothetical protein
MKKFILAILWAASLVCAYCAGRRAYARPDYSPPESLRAEFAKVQQLWTNVWLGGARTQPFGKFVLIRPTDEGQAALAIALLGRPHFPYVLIADDARFGRPDTFTLCDAGTNTITVFDADRDGVFDAVGMTTTNGAYGDRGLTGKWKFKEWPPH